MQSEVSSRKDANRRGLFQPWIEIPPETIEQVRNLYDQEQMLDAWKIASRFGPLEQWKPGEAAIMAGRLAGNLGSHQRSRIIFQRNWRAHRDQLAAWVYYIHDVLSRRGPFWAWDLAESRPSRLKNESRDIEVYWLTLQANMAWDFRDFRRADEWMREAEALEAGSPWVCMSRSSLLEKEDRYEAALEKAREGLAINPRHRPSLLQTSHLLQVLDRDEEAADLLTTACRTTQSGALVASLAMLEMELKRFDDANRRFEDYIRLSPLAPKSSKNWVAANRVAIACRTRNLADARTWVSGLDDPYHRALRQRLEEEKSDWPSSQVEVPFVRQHHLTCAPATLAALSRFWKQPVDHLEMVDQICYDGTPAHSQRQWLQARGYRVREFTVTWEIARALLDRGIPFTLTTSETTSSHLQSVVGYDTLRQSLFIRDPFAYHIAEALCPKFLERYQSTGPRGMVFVPEKESERLEGLTLPDASPYDQVHQVHVALDAHDRTGAAQVLDGMRAADPGHRLTLSAERSMAAYDENHLALLDCLNGLLRLFPEDGNLNLCKWSCLAQNLGRSENLEFLEGAIEKPNADPVFYSRLASELRKDGRRWNEAMALSKQALRFRPADPEFLKTHADLLADRGELARAVRTYRLAACAGELNEFFSQIFFNASRLLNQTEPALAFLRDRAAKLESKSCQPVFTLFDALVAVDRTADAMVLLDESLQKHPDDGDLLLFAADVRARFGRYEESRTLLKAAEARTRRTQWLRSAARLAAYESERKRALESWLEILRWEPLAVDAHRAVAHLLREIEGLPSALQFIDDACARHPRHCGLLQTRIELTEPRGARATADAIRAYLSANPIDAWAHRELASAAARLGDFEAADKQADEAIRLDPASPWGYSLRGSLRLKRGRRLEARSDFRRAIEIAIDTSYALDQWITTAQGESERQEAFEVVERELRRQVVFGDSLSTFRSSARGLASPEFILDHLHEARVARPDLPAAWSTEIHQLADMGRLSDAAALAAEACSQFQFHVRPWQDKARIHELRGELADAIRSMEQALSIDPTASFVLCRLAELHEKNAAFQEARRCLERAVIQAPLDSVSFGYLAALLWKLGEKDAALDKIENAIRLNPGYDWAWQTLRQWNAETNRADRALRLARDLVDRRPAEVRSWNILAECLFDGDLQEGLATINKAIQLDPSNAHSHEQKARFLVRLNRFEEAIASCRPPEIQPVPPSLRIREAWIDYQRGRLNDALRKLEMTVRDFPAAYSGWQLLSEWQNEAGNLAKAGEAADQMALLSPHDPVPLGWAGEIRERMGDPDGARERFERALELDPTYEFGGVSLIDLHFSREEWDAAEKVLRRMKAHAPSDFFTYREILLLGYRKRKEEALALFAKFCESPTANLACLEGAATCLNSLGLKRKTTQLILRLLRDGKGGPWLGSLWVKRRIASDKLGPDRTTWDLFKDSKDGLRALSTWLHGFARRFHELKVKKDIRCWFLPRHLKRVIARHQARMAADKQCWGQVGYALTTIEHYDRVIEWLGDWEKRSDLDGWMLYNLALSFEVTNQPAKVLPVLRRGLNLRQDADLFGSFACLASFEEAFQGDPESARQLEASISKEKLSNLDKNILQLSDVIQLNSETPGTERQNRFTRVREKLHSAFKENPPHYHHALIRRLYRRTIRKCAEQMGGSKRMIWWGRWNYMRSDWFVVGFLVVVSPLLIVTPPIGWILLVRLITRLTPRA